MILVPTPKSETYCRKCRKYLCVCVCVCVCVYVCVFVCRGGGGGGGGVLSRGGGGGGGGQGGKGHDKLRWLVSLNNS